MSTGEREAPPKRGRGRPPRISQERIVEAAIELGLDSFSMQGIAERLGVTPPALYSHVAGREEVLALVGAALRSRLQSFSSTATHWREWCTDFAQVVHRQLAGSGSSLMVGLRNPSTSGYVGVGEQGLRLLVDAGLPPADAGYALWLVFRLAVTAGPEAEATFDGYLGDARTLLGRDATDEFPATTAVNRALAAEGRHDVFEFDLQVVLDGIESRLAASTR